MMSAETKSTKQAKAAAIVNRSTVNRQQTTSAKTNRSKQAKAAATVNRSQLKMQAKTKSTSQLKM
jgi:hypothetical protein